MLSPVAFLPFFLAFVLVIAIPCENSPTLSERFLVVGASTIEGEDFKDRILATMNENQLKLKREAPLPEIA